MNITPTHKNMIHPLGKIFACLPVGREASLPDCRISPRFSEALHKIKKFGFAVDP